MRNSNKSFALIVVLCSFCLLHTSGCFADKNSLTAKLGWKAEEFFTDADTIRLCGAIDNKDLNAVKRILSTGIVLNGKGKEGMSPLIWSFTVGDMAIYEELLKAGADPNLKYYFDGPVFRPGESVVHLASRSSRTKYLALSLKHGGNPNLQRDSDGKTPLDVAVTALMKDKEINVAALIKSGANPDGAAGLGDSRRHTTLAYAVQWNAYRVAVMLIKAGASTGLIHPHIPPDSRNRSKIRTKRVVHILAKELGPVENPNSKEGYGLSKERAAALEELIELLEDHGERLQQAREDVERWRQELLERSR